MPFRLTGIGIDLVRSLFGDAWGKNAQRSTGLQSSNVRFGGAFKVVHTIEGIRDAVADDKDAMVPHDKNLDLWVGQQFCASLPLFFESQSAELIVDRMTIVENCCVLVDWG